MKKRNTVAKEQILNILKSGNEAFSQYDIQKRISVPADRATVYRLLKSYTEQGLVHKIVADDGKQYFAWCNSCENEKHSHNHFHFRCVDCGKVECLNTEVSINLPQGYSSNQLNAIITGNCSSCISIELK